MHRIKEKRPFVLENPVKRLSLKESSVIARQEKGSFFPSKKYNWSWARVDTELPEEIKWVRFSQRTPHKMRKNRWKY